MSKWKHVPEKRKKEIFAFNKSRAADREAAQDLQDLISALPPGLQKQLMKDAACAAILRKYGITE